MDDQERARLLEAVAEAASDFVHATNSRVSGAALLRLIEAVEALERHRAERLHDLNHPT